MGVAPVRSSVIWRTVSVYRVAPYPESVDPRVGVCEYLFKNAVQRVFALVYAGVGLYVPGHDLLKIRFE